MGSRIIEEQLLKDCLFAFNQIRNTRLNIGMTTYDLAKKIEATLNEVSAVDCEVTLSVIPECHSPRQFGFNEAIKHKDNPFDESILNPFEQNTDDYVDFAEGYIDGIESLGRLNVRAVGK